MGMLAGKERLTEAELDRLGEFLETCNGGKAMNLEEVDGFFAALVAGPRMVMPSEYLQEVWGGEDASPAFADLEEANEILGLLLRHWNAIAATLAAGEIYVPLVHRGEDGAFGGNDWAHGFIQGTHLSHEDWVELMGEDDRLAWMIPMLALVHEDDEDPKMRPGPMSPEKRERAIAYMAAGLLKAYQYFREPGATEREDRQPKGQRSRAKTGRNEPCPCGSGKKYKRCCGDAMIQ